MKKSTSFSVVLQKMIPSEEMTPILKEIGVVDTARKFTVYKLFLFLAEAAGNQWNGYRDGEQRMAEAGLDPVDHSTISLKTKNVPYEVFEGLLDLVISKCNRQTIRKLAIPKYLLVVDSTKVTVGLGSLPWPPPFRLKGRDQVTC